MYNIIFQKIFEYKKKNNKDGVREVILSFCDELEGALKGKLDYRTFSDFIRDEKMFFKSDFVESRAVDKSISTKGLLTQSLSFIGVVNSEILSDSLKESLYNLHSSVSRSLDNIDRERQDLLEKVGALKDSIL